MAPSDAPSDDDAPPVTPDPSGEAPETPDGTPPDTTEPETPATPEGDEPPEEAEEAETPFTGQVNPALEAELTPIVADLKKAGSKGALKILSARIPTLVEQREAALHRARAAEAELQQLREQPPKPAPAASAPAPEADPLHNHPTVAPLTQEISTLESNLVWLEENPEGGTATGPDGQSIDLSAEQVRRLKRNAERRHQQLVVQRETRLETIRTETEKERQANHSKALQEFPWLDQPESQEHELAMAVRSKFQQEHGVDLARRPDGLLILGTYVRGILAGRKPANGAPAKPPLTRKPNGAPAPVGAPAGGSGAAPARGASDKLAEAHAKARRTGAPEDWKEVRKLQRSRTPAPV